MNEERHLNIYEEYKIITKNLREVLHKNRYKTNDLEYSYADKNHLSQDKQALNDYAKTNLLHFYQVFTRLHIDSEYRHKGCDSWEYLNYLAKIKVQLINKNYYIALYKVSELLGYMAYLQPRVYISLVEMLEDEFNLEPDKNLLAYKERSVILKKGKTHDLDDPSNRIGSYLAVFLRYVEKEKTLESIKSNIMAMRKFIEIDIKYEHIEGIDIRSERLVLFDCISDYLNSLDKNNYNYQEIINHLEDNFFYKRADNRLENEFVNQK